jgi:hypothetical protein
MAGRLVDRTSVPRDGAVHGGPASTNAQPVSRNDGLAALQRVIGSADVARFANAMLG